MGIARVAAAALAWLFAAFVLLMALDRVDALHFGHMPLELILSGAGGAGTMFLGFLGIASRNAFRLGGAGQRLRDV